MGLWWAKPPFTSTIWFLRGVPPIVASQPFSTWKKLMCFFLWVTICPPQSWHLVGSGGGDDVQWLQGPGNENNPESKQVDILNGHCSLKTSLLQKIQQFQDFRYFGIAACFWNAACLKICRVIEEMLLEFQWFNKTAKNYAARVSRYIYILYIISTIYTWIFQTWSYPIWF